MEKEIKMLEDEIREIDKFEKNDEDLETVTFSHICGANLTIFCC